MGSFYLSAVVLKPVMNSIVFLACTRLFHICHMRFSTFIIFKASEVSPPLTEPLGYPVSGELSIFFLFVRMDRLHNP